MGGNESGKSNLLLDLWKLNPARDGKKLKYAKDDNDHYKPTPGDVNDATANVSKFHWARAEYVLDNYDKLPDFLPLNCGVVRINPDFYIFSMGGEPGCNH